MLMREQLAAIMPSAMSVRVGTYLLWLNEYMPQYDITTRLRQAAFLATIAEESGQLLYTRELWGPTPAQEQYEPPSPKAAELGNTEPGDGRRFKGRGLIQITGRANYQAAQDALGQPYVDEPILMQAPAEATRTACWWWATHGCNELADIPDFEAVTRRVNGGLTHYDRRKAYYEHALAALQETT